DDVSLPLARRGVSRGSVGDGGTGRVYSVPAAVGTEAVQREAARLRLRFYPQPRRRPPRLVPVAGEEARHVRLRAAGVRRREAVPAPDLAARVFAGRE